MTIRWRLTWWFTALVAGLLLIRAVTSWMAFETSSKQDMAQIVHERAKRVHDFIAGLAAENRYEEVYLILRKPDLLPRAFSDDGLILQVVDLQGRVVARSPNLGRELLPWVEPGQYAPVTLPLPNWHSPHWLVYGYPLVVRGAPLGTIQVAITMQAVEMAARRLLFIEITGLLVGASLALVLGYWLAGRALAPVAKLTATVCGLQPSDLDSRVDESSPDEIGRLGKTFNDLLDRIETAFDAQQRFVSDASHELRSPLTAIRGHVQLLQKRGRDNPELLERGLDTVLKEADRLSRLVDDLLLLARGQGMGQTMAPPVDLLPVIKEMIGNYQPLHPNLRLGPLPVVPLTVAIDPDRFRQILLNLLTNALRYTPADKAVTVSWSQEGQRGELSVQDEGCGIPAEHLPHIFERFYRIDGARERSRGGTGLGLAIVNTLAQVTGGEIAVTSTVGQGTRFTVSWPLAPVPNGPVPIGINNPSPIVG